MTRQLDHSARIRKLTHAETYMEEGSERDAEIDAAVTVGPRQLRGGLPLSGSQRLVRCAKRNKITRSPAINRCFSRKNILRACFAWVDFVDLIPVRLAQQQNALPVLATNRCPKSVQGGDSRHEG